MIETASPGVAQKPNALKGLSVVAALAVLAWFGSSALGKLGLTWISPVFLAVVMGLVLRNVLGARAAWKPGIDLTSKRLLRVGIALLGIQFTLERVFESGAEAALAVCVIIGATGVTVVFARRFTNTGGRLSYLIGIGTAICGNSAIIATAPVIKAKDEEISYATFTITAFGMAAMLAYPLIGQWLSFDAAQYGMLAGAGIHDSAQSIASGFIYSDAAGGEAAIVKLTRVAFLAPIVLITAWTVASRDRKANGVRNARKVVPWFAVGFVAVSGVRSVGDSFLGAASIWVTTVDGLRTAALALIVAAMVAVGLATDLAKLRSIGFRPFVLGLVTSAVAGGIALAFAVSR